MRRNHLAMPQECPITLYLNDKEFVTIQATPQHLDDFARGFLLNEGLVGSLDAIQRLVIDEEKAIIWVDLAGSASEPEAFGTKRYITSGCGRGITFSSVRDAMNLRPVTHGLMVSRPKIADWMRFMQKETPLYYESGGVHAAMAVVAATGEGVVREDIGRHNAIDKALGAAFARGWQGPEMVVLTSGRISYEMCTKLARHGIAVGASRTAATDQAGRLAEKLGIALVGYVRGNEMTIYTTSSRIDLDEARI